MSQQHVGTGPSAPVVGASGSQLETAVADFTESVVPLSARRSNFRMLLTFGSMQLVFGAVLVGYDARFQGMTLGRLILAMAIAAAAMTVYCLGSANVGAVVGQTHAVTTRGIFGTLGSAIVSLLLVIDGMGFYLFTVLFIITLGQALIGTLPAVALITAILAFVMIVNIVTGIGAVTVPVASTIMAMDVFVLPRLFGLRRPLYRVATWSELAFANWPAIVALLAGTAVGAVTGGLIPGTAGFGKTYIGFPALQAWATGAVVYLVLAGIVSAVSQQAGARKLLGYSAIEELPTATPGA
jgi:purine-cytosine permease-like protein